MIQEGVVVYNYSLILSKKRLCYDYSLYKQLMRSMGLEINHKIDNTFEMPALSRLTDVLGKLPTTFIVATFAMTITTTDAMTAFAISRLRQLEKR